VVPEIREIRRLKFLAPLVAGDLLILDVTAEDQPGHTPFDVVAECRRGDGIVAASLKVGFGW
jgi:hypothetical protein